MGRWRWVAQLVLIGILWGAPLSALAQEPSTADRLRAVAHEAEEGAAAAKSGDVTEMRHAYDEIHEAWEGFEDGVREQDAKGYLELEQALDTLKDTLAAEPIDAAKAYEAFELLEHEANEVAARIAGGTGATAVTDAQPADVLKQIAAATAALERGDTETALEQVEQAEVTWPAVEGAIAAKSQDDYHAIEDDLGAAAAALEAQPADTALAAAALQRLTGRLTPYAGSQTYSFIDVAAILLREGLEALLVIVALLAFLRQSGNADKSRWIWAGGALGVLASVGVAFVLQALFSQALAGQSRELIEGATGLVAAALLFYVSYWLHSNANLRVWKRYIDEQTTRALARGSMVSLALLAFLAVFREGAETVVFYLGMAPSLSVSDLLIGLGIGVAVLIVAAVLMLVVGMRLPLRLFFRVAGLLVYYLGFKFVGTGLHALQVAGILPSSPAMSVPSLPAVGIYPTWETTLPQLLIVALAIVLFFYLRSRDSQMSTGAPSAAS